ncbi:MAG: DUF1275 domain-containing protein [Pseudobutyrivibrio sp.]|nr:DUF1275 domain-containing protein [Pseudobutyrivibrio sp.]
MKAKHTSESFLLSAIISLSGGFQDAYTYNLRDNVFANAQTGNIVLMTQHLLLGDWIKSIHYLFPILAFAIGIVIAEQIGYRYKNSQRIHWRQIILIIEIIALFIVAFVPSTHNTLANFLVSMACAMQVQSFRKVNGYAYASTMCIGNLRSGMESLSAYLRNRDKNILIKALHYFGIIFIFAIGAGVGGVFSLYVGNHAILICSVLLVIAVIVMNEKHIG